MEEKDLQGATIQIASEMEATLSGRDFEILAVTPEAQVISIQKVTNWQWDVVPKRGGKQTLHLTLNVLLQVNSRSAKRAIRTFDKTVEVNVTLKRRALDFGRDNWRWLWTVVVGPGAGIPLLIAWLKRRKKKNAELKP